MEVLFTTEALSALLTLTFLEIVLGIDNILFISVVAGKVAEQHRKKATQWGLLLAMFLRLGLLLGISVFLQMQKTFYSFKHSLLSVELNGQSVILAVGGLFLLYKSTKEIFEKVEGHQQGPKDDRSSYSFNRALLQIIAINLVFSFDSILTAIGMTNGLVGALEIMAIAVIISVIIMMIFAGPVGSFIEAHPSLQVLGLSFLLLIGFMLLAEAAHLSHLVIWNQAVGAVPKGYLYFAIAFSLGVEFINMKIRKR